MNAPALHVFELHNAGQTRLIAGSLDSLPPLDIPQPTERETFGRTALHPAPQRQRAPRGWLRTLFGA